MSQAPFRPSNLPHQPAAYDAEALAAYQERAHHRRILRAAVMAEPAGRAGAMICLFGIALSLVRFCLLWLDQGVPDPAWLVLSMMLGLIGAFCLSLQRRTTAAGKALRRLAARWGAALAKGGPVPALDWLDAHWPASAPSAIMLSRPEGGGIERGRWTVNGAFAGWPFLIVVSHGPLDHVRVYVLVARGPVSEAGWQARRAQLAQSGWSVSLTRAGIVLEHRNDDRVVLEPGRLEQALGLATGGA